ncbi:MAG: type II secretion system protein GspG [Armatimonadetes bacterium]|nr:type II secretion system protein GspG [Armatimonadota bacterium]
MRHSTRRGMSPLELILALVVVVALALGFFQWVNVKAESDKRKLTIRRLVQVETALRKYCADCAGAFPTEKQGLIALYEKPTASPVPKGWLGPYVTDKRVIEDAWGRCFKYVCPGRPYAASDVTRPFDLASYGRDGCEGGRGLDRDILSWDRKTMVP